MSARHSLLRVLAGAAVALTLLAACSEREQTVANRGADAEPWQGADARYTAPGWKAGDKTTWEEQMNRRAITQNEYKRIR